MKNRRIILISLICFGLLTLFGIAYAKSEIYFELGKSIGEIKKQADKDTVVAEIGNTQITKKHFNNVKTAIKINSDGKFVKDEEVLNALAENVSLYEEAKKRGLQVSKEETIKLMEEIRQNILNNNTSYAQFQQYLNGLGMTDTEYWNDEGTIETYQEVFTIAELKNKVLSEANIKPEDTDKYWDNFTKQLKNNIKIKKIN